MRYTVRRYGDPVLRQKAVPIERVTDEIRKLAEDMLETVGAERGVGLAAPQIGKTLALCVIAVPEDYDRDETGRRLHPGVTMPLILVNPKIAWKSGEAEKAEEGCLSFPEISAHIPRALEIEVEFLDRDGVSRRLRLEKFLARVVQHEVDHLNGVLFIDHMSAVKRVALAGQLKRMRKETERALDRA